MSGRLLAAVLLLFGMQQLCIGYFLIGGVCLALGFGKGRGMAPVILTLVLAVGICSGLHERALQRNPPAPRGTVVIEAASWRLEDSWASFSGRAANGVPVTGIVSVNAAERRKITALSGPVRLNWTKSVQIARPRNLAEFDYRAFAWRQNHQAYQIETGTLAFTRERSLGLQSWLQGLRLGTLRRIDGLPSRVRAYAQALLLGMMQGDAADMRPDFSKLGILHLFSVSGLHIFAIIGMAYTVMRYLRVTRETCDSLLLLGLPVLLVIIPMSTGLLRAVFMRLTAIVAEKLHIPFSTFDCFCLVLAANLIYRPQILGTMGGQLTYLLTLVLIVGESRGGIRQCLIMAVVSAPPLLASVYGVHLLTFLFNFLLMPLFESLIMPVLLILVAWPHCPFVHLVNTLLMGLDGLLHWLAGMPGYLLVGQIPSVMALLLCLTVLIVIGRRNRWPLVMVLVATVVLTFWRPQWRVSLFALGSGEAMLIEAPFRREAVLIGTGGSEMKLNTKAAERIITNYLHARGIARLDALILAPATRQAVGDAGVIVRTMKPKLLITTSTAGKTRLVKQVISADSTPVVTLANKATLPLRTFQLHILAVSGAKSRGGALMYAKIDNKNWLIPTSVAATVQLRSLRQANLRADYLVLGQHGAQSGVSADLLRYAQPKMVLVAASTSGFLRLPSATVAAQVQEVAPLMRTDEAGMIWTDGADLHTLRSLR